MMLDFSFIRIKPFYLVALFCICFMLPTTSSSGQTEQNVYVFIAEECPISIYMAKHLREVATTYTNRVNLFLVFPKKNSSMQSAQKFLDKYALSGFEIILDPHQELTKKLGGTITPEVVVTDTHENILYQGRITDRYFAIGKMRHVSKTKDLWLALEKIIHNQDVPKPWHKAVGCYITFTDG